VDDLSVASSWIVSLDRRILCQLRIWACFRNEKPPAPAGRGDAEGCKSRGDRTAIELFAADVAEWHTGVVRAVEVAICRR
jgi:hypothetical protein